MDAGRYEVGRRIIYTMYFIVGREVSTRLQKLCIMLIYSERYFRYSDLEGRSSETVLVTMLKMG